MAVVVPSVVLVSVGCGCLCGCCIYVVYLYIHIYIYTYVCIHIYCIYPLSFLFRRTFMLTFSSQMVVSPRLMVTQMCRVCSSCKSTHTDRIVCKCAFERESCCSVRDPGSHDTTFLQRIMVSNQTRSHHMFPMGISLVNRDFQLNFN